jgi:hypothetical protein
LRRFHAAGHKLPYDVTARIAEDAGGSLNDLDDCWWAGTATGELFKTLFLLAKTAPGLTSWNSAIKIFELVAVRNKAKGSRAELWDAKRRFVSVAHLWGAWCIREGRFGEQPEVGYNGFDDFQSFLAEAEILRDWGQSWCPARAKSSPLLPLDAWRVPDGWAPPIRRTGWPKTGVIRILHLPDHLVAELKPAGRPRRAS